MNDLSWLLYWASVAPQLSAWLCIVSFLGFFLSLVASGLAVVAKFEAAKSARLANTYLTKHEAWMPDAIAEVRNHVAKDVVYRALRWGWLPAPVFLVTWGLSFTVPDKDTFYLIAASETGQKAIETPEFAKIRAVVNKYLDKMSEPDKAPSK